MLFAMGTVGVLVNRNALRIFMSVELQLNAVNLTLVAFARMHNDLDGQVLAFFSMVVAAAEVVVGLAIIVSIYRRRRSDRRRRRPGDAVVETLTPHAASALWLIPAIPLAAVATLNLFFGKRLGRWAGVLATVAVAVSFAVSRRRRRRPPGVPGGGAPRAAAPVRLDLGRAGSASAPTCGSTR